MAIMRSAIAAADAGLLVRNALAAPEIAEALRAAAAVDVIAAGKAAAPMLQACTSGTGNREWPVVHGLPPAGPIRQVVGVAPAPPEGRSGRVLWHAAAHPVPDGRSVAAAQQVIEIAAALGRDDLLVLLLSGGASSFVALPAEAISLADKQETTRFLLAHGANIHELNTVRKHMSAIKGGQLAAVVSGTVLTLAVSDVVDDDVSVIGSGPAVPDETTFGVALAVLDRHGGTSRYPRAVTERFERGVAGRIPETPKPGDPRLARVTAHVIGGRRSAMEGARAVAESLGYAACIIDEPTTGAARVAGRALVERAARALARRDLSRPVCVLASGETTVRVTGGGKGGRNQECALGMVRALDTLGPAVVATSVGTDGIDCPTDAAGAIVDSTTLARADTARLDAPELYLDNNNAYDFFNRLGDLICTGPTATNVGDLQVVLVGGW